MKKELSTYDVTPEARRRMAEDLATAHGWRIGFIKTENCLIRFRRGKDQVLDYWYTRNTVGTIVTHPKRGRGQLFRKYVDYPTLKALFINPRQHTGVGYYTRC